MKLVALPEALKDVNEAIKTDNTFGKFVSVFHLAHLLISLKSTLVKAYIRKSNILFAMRDHTQAIDAIQEAKDRDVDHKHTTEITQQEYKCQQALFSQRGEESQEETLARAMRDPEVAVCPPSTPSHSYRPL